MARRNDDFRTGNTVNEAAQLQGGKVMYSDQTHPKQLRNELIKNAYIFQLERAT